MALGCDQNAWGDRSAHVRCGGSCPCGSGNGRVPQPSTPRDDTECHGRVAERLPRPRQNTWMSRAMIIIREERPDDVERIRAVNLAAFESATEADLVNALRERVSPLISLVAEDDT